LGPGANARALRRHPDRAAYLYASDEAGSTPVLYPYDEGIELLWGE
nr:hypothetical protein [Gemmatimonadota bacterium]NIR80027.1 hypothetical protein [Gemmatimonadota bacterium]NIT88762.1 hypothetical protein [Gemmatimonadota bacterium]NIU32569.1 hypothetical protein [Gemmatimonadota bacterium]NIU37027.1 hypothetical protein [Gemmatimonadota bacterium]